MPYLTAQFLKTAMPFSPPTYAHTNRIFLYPTLHSTSISSNSLIKSREGLIFEF
ncbi:MAG: hypothetical protein MUE81_00200 [Thermoflexibacter sp.]|nr:hypothetical protein [Thermoflexibacter sp.]